MTSRSSSSPSCRPASRTSEQHRPQDHFALFKVLYLGLPSPPEDQVVNTWIIVDFQFKKISWCRTQAIWNPVTLGRDRRLLTPTSVWVVLLAIVAQPIEMFIIQTCFAEHMYSVKKKNTTCIWVPALDHFLMYLCHFSVISCARAGSYVKGIMSYKISWLFSP